MIDHRGPFIQSALFCDYILREQDGTISIIRMIDTVYVDIKRVEPGTQVSVPVHIRCLVSLKAGEYVGNAKVEIVREDRPDYHSGELWTHTIDFIGNGATLGVNLIIDLQFPVRESREEWFGVYVNQVLLTRMPLQVILEMPQSE